MAELRSPLPRAASAAQPPAGCQEAAGPRPARFPPEQRRILLLQTGLGEGVLSRLEAAGYASIEALRAEGVQEVMDEVSERAGHGAMRAMRNRCRALERAIAAWAECCASGRAAEPGASALRAAR